MPVDFFTVVGTVGAGITIAETTKKMHSKVGMLKKRLLDGYLKIGVFGAGGTGKTSLGYFVTGEWDKIDVLYQESPTDEKVDIGKNIMGVIWIAPGQLDRIDSFWHKMFREIVSGKVRNVINVVSYGFHSVAFTLENYQQHKLYENGDSKEQFLQKFLHKNREHEIRLMKELSHRIKDAQEPVKMITLVTKQDLWWKEREQVKGFYTNGGYNDIIQNIYKKKGENHFQHVYVSASFIHNNFNIGKDVLKLTNEGYDQVLKIQNLEAFMNEYNAFLQ